MRQNQNEEITRLRQLLGWEAYQAPKMRSPAEVRQMLLYNNEEKETPKIKTTKKAAELTDFYKKCNTYYSVFSEYYEKCLTHKNIKKYHELYFTLHDIEKQILAFDEIDRNARKINLLATAISAKKETGSVCSVFISELVKVYNDFIFPSCSSSLPWRQKPNRFASFDTRSFENISTYVDSLFAAFQADYSKMSWSDQNGYKDIIDSAFKEEPQASIFSCSITLKRFGRSSCLLSFKKDQKVSFLNHIDIYRRSNKESEPAQRAKKNHLVRKALEAVCKLEELQADNSLDTAILNMRRAIRYASFKIVLAQLLNWFTFGRLLRKVARRPSTATNPHTLYPSPRAHTSEPNHSDIPLAQLPETKEASYR